MDGDSSRGGYVIDDVVLNAIAATILQNFRAWPANVWMLLNSEGCTIQ